jgi:hypothetical protein
MKYLRAKWDHYVDSKLKQIQVTTDGLEFEEQQAKFEDREITHRLEYMYNYFDYRNDRHRVRERFVKHMNKKTTLGDVGALLDKWVLDNKASTEHFHPEVHLLEQPARAKKDVKEDQLYWSSSFLKDMEGTKPTWFEDASEVDHLNNHYGNLGKEILKEVEWNDAHRDLSKEALTPEENLEVSLFHSFK